MQRGEVEAKIIEFMNNLDPSGYNGNMYREMFKQMNKNQFDQYMSDLKDKPDVNLYAELPEKIAPDMNKIEKIAKKYDIKLEEYVMFPHKNPDNLDKPFVTKLPVPIFVVPIRRLEQMLSKKNSASADTSTVNPLTGQVVGDSKSASFTDTQTVSLVTSNQTNTISELLGPRGDDIASKSKMLRAIERNGSVKLEELDMKSDDKQSIKTVKVFLRAALFDIELKEKK